MISTSLLAASSKAAATTSTSTSTSTSTTSTTALLPDVVQLAEGRHNRRVHFATRSQTLYFLPSRPISATRKPLYELHVEAGNCREIVDRNIWLSNPQILRKEPHCQLDYLKVEEANKTLDDDEENEYWASLEETHFTVDDCVGESNHGFHVARQSVQSNNNAQTDVETFNLTGEVAVNNLAYQKEVLVHFTVDGWRSHQTVAARYVSSVAVLRIDKFRFHISFDSSHCVGGGNLELALEYRVSGRTYWNSNDGRNFRFNLSLRPMTGVFNEDIDQPEIPLPVDEECKQGIPIPESKKSGLSSSLSSYSSLSPKYGQPIQVLGKSHISVAKSVPIPPLPKVVETPLIASSWDSCTKSFTLIAMASATSGHHVSQRPLEPFVMPFT